MDADAIHRGIMLKNGLRAVTMMMIPIDNQHAVEAVHLGITNRCCQGMKHTITMPPVGIGVMAAEAETIGTVKTPRAHLIDSLKHAAQAVAIPRQAVFHAHTFAAQ